MISKKQWLIIGAISVVVLSTILILVIKRKKNKTFKSKIKNNNPKKILIARDSQSAIQTSSGKKITHTYPNLLIKNLPNVKIDVLAIGGKTSD